LAEIHSELKTPNDLDLKVQGLLKLSYLHMLGYDMAFAAFHTIEVMASPKLEYKVSFLFGGGGREMGIIFILGKCIKLFPPHSI
jgi:hypothetical protein